jgi:hypothetical protein
MTGRSAMGRMHGMRCSSLNSWIGRHSPLVIPPGGQIRALSGYIPPTGRARSRAAHSGPSGLWTVCGDRQNPSSYTNSKSRRYLRWFVFGSSTYENVRLSRLNSRRLDFILDLESVLRVETGGQLEKNAVNGTKVRRFLDCFHTCITIVTSLSKGDATL